MGVMYTLFPILELYEYRWLCYRVETRKVLRSGSIKLELDHSRIGFGVPDPYSPSHVKVELMPTFANSLASRGWKGNSVEVGHQESNH